MSEKSRFEERLEGGKAFSLGNTVEVVNDVIEKPDIFSDYLILFSSDNSQVVMRASNGLKRIFDDGTIPFEQHKKAVIELLRDCPHDSARWTLVQLLKKYKNSLDEQELKEAFSIARRFALESEEWITLAQSMDLLAKLKSHLIEDEELVSRAVQLSGDDRKTVSKKAENLLKALGANKS